MSSRIQRKPCNTMRMYRKIEQQNTAGTVQYHEDVSKANAGGLKDRKVKPKVTRAYENKVNPERCIVRLYQTTSACGKKIDY